jgi:hypothetical protein
VRSGDGSTAPPLYDAHDVIDFAAIEQGITARRERYLAARPFPHTVIDDLLPEATFRAAAQEFPDVDEEIWTNWVHVNSRKFGNAEPDTWPPTLRAVARGLTSPRFVAWLEAVTGHEHLIADWSMDGGGLHQSGAGGFLNVHADFTSHHVHKNWRRRVNVLLYLNEHWDPSWGGALELWSPDMQRCAERIEPLGNRMLVFTTSESSFHGHPDPMSCPPDVYRRSLALYYYVAEKRPLHRSTDYRARPGDGLHAVAIYLDKKALQAFDLLKRRFRLSDAAASRLLRTIRRLSGRR